MRKKTAFGLIILSILLLGLLIHNNITKLTYLEYESLNEADDTAIQIDNNDNTLVQYFYMPYSILHGISIKVGTYGKDNNSEWDISVVRYNDDKVCALKHVNASVFSDNSYCYIEFDKNVLVHKNDLYYLKISPTYVNENNGIQFYVSSQATNNDLLYNDLVIDGTMCLTIYGGEVDIWWISFLIFLIIIAIAIIIRCYYVSTIKKKIIIDDPFLQSALVMFVCFALLFPFSNLGVFIDELDNMRGGMIISQGGVLYKDYVTQHTPFLYYLCALFALLGAKSIAQFRILFYFMYSMICGLIYIRYKKIFGNKVIVMALCEPIITIVLIGSQAVMITSDFVQGVSTVVLLLEMYSYMKDKSIDWKRSIIVSLCIFSCIGSAFVSIYAIFWFVIVFILVESNYIRTRYEKNIFNIYRYIKLLVSCFVPIMLVLFFFSMKDALKIAINQFYTFNRTIYPNYLGDFGRNIYAPFIIAFHNLFNIVKVNIESIINAQVTSIILLQLIVLIAALAIIVLLFIQKQILWSLLLLCVMCCSATRGFDTLHGLPAWNVAIMIVIMNSGMLIANVKKYQLMLALVIIIYCLSPFIDKLSNCILYKQIAVSELESRIIALTEDNEEIVVDYLCCDTLYFLYKNRKQVNSVSYMLPWYMDCFEQNTINELQENDVRIVVYNEDQETWGRTHYAENFLQYLNSNYVRFSNNPAEWGYKVWMNKKYQN